MVLLMANHGSLANVEIYSFFGAALATSRADETYSSADTLETKASSLERRSLRPAGTCTLP